MPKLIPILILIIIVACAGIAIYATLTAFLFELDTAIHKDLAKQPKKGG